MMSPLESLKHRSVMLPIFIITVMTQLLLITDFLPFLQHVMNFEWYVSVLVELTKMKSTNHGKQLGDQMMDVAIRVVAVRKFTIGQMAILLENSHLFAHNSQKDGICEILFAAAWLCGEFAE